MFRYPCRHRIDSEAFDGLPTAAFDYVDGCLNEILSGRDTSDLFRHLSANDREALRQILLENKPDFAEHIGKSNLRF